MSICWFVGIGFLSSIYAVDVSGFCGVVLGGAAELRCIFVLVSVVLGGVVLWFRFVVRVVMILVHRVGFDVTKMAVLLVCVMR